MPGCWSRIPEGWTLLYLRPASVCSPLGLRSTCQQAQDAWRSVSTCFLLVNRVWLSKQSSLTSQTSIFSSLWKTPPPPRVGLRNQP
jgi:hypothetical protein